MAESPIENEQASPRDGRRWPAWVALAAAAISAVAMVISQLALRSAEQSADDAEAQLASTAEEAGQLEAEVAADDEPVGPISLRLRVPSRQGLSDRLEQ